jgi:hypothetical protein
LQSRIRAAHRPRAIATSVHRSTATR